MTNLLTGVTPPVIFAAGDLTTNAYADVSAAGTGANAASSAWYYVGGYSHQAAITSGANTDRAEGRLTVATAGNGKYYLRAYFQVAARGTYTDYDSLCILQLRHTSDGINSAVNSLCALAMRADNSFIDVYATDSAGNHWTNFYTGALNLDTTYEIQVLYDVSGANVVVQAWLDGVALLRYDTGTATWTGNGRAATYTPDRLNVGVASLAAAAASYATVRWDAIRVEDAQIASGEPISGAATATPTATAAMVGVGIVGGSAEATATAGATMVGIAIISGGATATATATATMIATLTAWIRFTLQPRNYGFTLDDRSFAFTLMQRSFAFTLEERSDDE